MNNRVTGKIVRKVLGIAIFLFLTINSYATHQVGGYISYKCLGGNTYQITIYDYTNTYLTTADRDTMRIWWGDGQNQLLYRANGPIDQNGYPNGDPICNYDFSQSPPSPLEDARKANIYQGVHTYVGPGNYHLWFDDPDRMANITNITNSVGVDFYIYATICINEFTTGCVNSPLITNDPVCQYGCAGVCYTYNPGAYIPTPPTDANDSIIYSLGTSQQLNPNNLTGETVSGYYNPGAVIDPITGTLSWCPAQAGKWNFVILMTTIRRTYYTVGGQTVRVIVPVDTVELELEVIINGNCNYNPTITSKDTCIVAGGTVNITYKAQDAASIPIYITDAGEPFSLTPPAVLSNYAPPRSVIDPKLTWTTNCAEVRANPYEVVIKATEKIPGGGFPPDTNYYSAYGTSLITVVGPAPLNLTATVQGTTVCLTWNESPCAQAIGYNIYRKIGCF